VKGLPWSIELEKELKDLVEAKTSITIIATKLNKPEEAVRQKIRRLGLEVVEQKKLVCSTTSLPRELPSVEETLKTLSAALKSLETPGLDKNEILRLRCLIIGAKVYKELLADYVNYKGLEAELLELREKYAELAKKTQGVSPK
jgi:hypothetical protein